MSQPNGPVCPECAAPRASDGTPACSCARRASEARRDARTAEAAAAEDFDPVRIRPFVELGAETGAVTSAEDEVPRESGDLADPDADPTPSDTAAPAPVPDSGDPHEDPRQRRRRTLLITGAVATLAVLLTSAFLSGLFLYDSPSRDRAASDDVRAPVPDASTEDGTSPEGQSAGTASASPSE
ncbi:peptidoglycan-binding protein, partial [Streptomyces muensis]|nr:peptidoglycan-binding protein [Streptomyces muensis]